MQAAEAPTGRTGPTALAVVASISDFVDHHRRLEPSMRAMLGRESVKPGNNAPSLRLGRNAAPTPEMLRVKAGREFDVTYTLPQIRSHQTTPDPFDTSRIPSARGPEMKAIPRDTGRPLVAHRVVRIVRIRHQPMGAAHAPGQ